MTEQAWRDQLKAGDEVYISQRFGVPARRDTVSRVTATQIMVRNNSRSESAYRKKDGYLVGAYRFYRSSLIMPSDERREAAEIYQLQATSRRLIERLKVPKEKAALVEFVRILSELVGEVQP